MSDEEKNVRPEVELRPQGEQRELDQLRKENTILRGIVANANIPCIYCGLENMSECKRGFPGCAKADDMICGDQELGMWLIEDNRNLKELLHQALDLLSFAGTTETNYMSWMRACKELEMKIGEVFAKQKSEL